MAAVRVRQNRPAAPPGLASVVRPRFATRGKSVNPTRALQRQDSGGRATRLGLLFALPLVLSGGFLVGAPGPRGDAAAAEPVSAQFDLASAWAEGDLTLQAEEGALIAKGAPRMLVLDAAEMTVRVVRVHKTYVDNPLGKDVAYADSREERHVLRGARLELVEAGERALLYAFRDRSAVDSGAFTIRLGDIRGDPLRPVTEDMELVVTEPGHPYTFHHRVPAPAFGVASGDLDGPFTAPLSGVRADGALVVVLDHVVAHVRSVEGSLEFRTGQWRTNETRVGPLTPRYDAERAYAVIEARDAQLRLDASGSDARFLTAKPTFYLDGLLRVPRAEGRLALPEARSVRGEVVEMVGNLTIRPRATMSDADVVPLREREARVSAAVEGDASVRVQGQLLGPPTLPEEARAAGFLALAAGLLAAAWGALQKGLAPVLFPAYARLLGRELLSHRHRLAVYDAVARRPFVHLRELQRSIGVGFGTMAYHTALLKREGYLASVRTGREELFYVRGTGFGDPDMKRLARLAHPTRRAIGEAVLAGVGTQEGLASRLGMTRKLVSKHLAVLEEAGLVGAQGARNKLYRATPLLAAWLRASAAAPAPPSNAVAAKAMSRAA